MEFIAGMAIGTIIGIVGLTVALLCVACAEEKEGKK